MKEYDSTNDVVIVSDLWVGHYCGNYLFLGRAGLGVGEHPRVEFQEIPVLENWALPLIDKVGGPEMNPDV